MVNPRAGQGRALALLEPLLAALKRRGYRPAVLVTEDRTDAARWAADCRRSPDYLVCLCGDDTLDDLAPAAIRHRIPLIATPLGFGNVCAQAFGHRAELPAILRLIERGRPVEIDVGLAQDARGTRRIFLAVAMYGFLETIKAMAERGRDGYGDTRRTFNYILATAKWLLPGHALSPLAVEVDGERLLEDAAFALIANLPVFPGKLLFTPHATPRDGLFDICVVAGPSKRAAVAALAGLLLGAPPAERRILRRRGRVVAIAAASPGAPAGRAETLRVLPRSLVVLAPPLEAEHPGGDTIESAIGHDPPLGRVRGFGSARATAHTAPPPS